MKFKVFLFLIFSHIFLVNGYIDIVIPDRKFALDLNLFEDVLDQELCDEQLRYIVEEDGELLFEFMDAGVRAPRGILLGNTVDLGNYYQCLGINQEIPDSVVEGKYCLVNVPLDQDIDWPELPGGPEWPDFPWPDIPWPDFPGTGNTSILNSHVKASLKEYNLRKAGADTVFGGNVARIAEDSQLSSISLTLATCIPKVCSTERVINTFVNATELGFQYRDIRCRLPNDKPWLAGDYVAVSIFGLFALLAILSTAYDIRHHVYLETDPKRLNKLFMTFSVYTNTRRLVTYTPVPGALECLDGVRAFAMMYVIIGHTFVNQISSGIMANPTDMLDYITSLRSVWVTAGPITVDTFFMLSGLLLVYTTNGKLKPLKLLKNLHLFYLNRLLRMFPVLAATILIQISFLNWMLDGPYWEVQMLHVNRCREYWWTTLLHVQNFVNPSGMCLSHSWYLAIDVQLHILSPILLVWILSGNKKYAWSAMIGGLVAILAASTTFNFIRNFQSGPVIPSRTIEEQNYYLTRYYVNTLTRASPFFVGLIVGYLLSIYREQKIAMSRISAAVLWLCSITILCLTIYSSYPIMQLDWDNQFADNMINSFMRPGWGMAVGWIIFACSQGYGGPVNWILSLRMWKVLGRLSYAMYLTHYPMIFAVNAMPVSPVWFNVPDSFLKFFIDFSLAVLVSFVVTILIDSPCALLIKYAMGGGIKKTPIKTAHNNGIDERPQEKPINTKL